MDLIDRNAVLRLPRNVTKNLSGEVIEETIDVDRIKNLQPFECIVDRWCTDCGEYDAKNHRCPRFNRVIRETVEEIQTERKKGQWIIKDNPGTGWYRVTCSECGEDVTSTIPVIGFFPDAKPIWNFCPDCGADMRGETDEGR